MSGENSVLVWTVIIAGSLFLIHAIPLALIMFIYRSDLDFKYVFLGIRGDILSAEEGRAIISGIQDIAEGKTKTIQQVRHDLKDNKMNQSQDKELQSTANLTESGKRWEELQREYSNMATEKYYGEYPNHRPPAQPVGTAKPESEKEGEL